MGNLTSEDSRFFSPSLPKFAEQNNDQAENVNGASAEQKSHEVMELLLEAIEVKMELNELYEKKTPGNRLKWSSAFNPVSAPSETPSAPPSLTDDGRVITRESVALPDLLKKGRTTLLRQRFSADSTTDDSQRYATRLNEIHARLKELTADQKVIQAYEDLRKTRLKGFAQSRIVRELRTFEHDLQLEDFKVHRRAHAQSRSLTQLEEQDLREHQEVIHQVRAHAESMLVDVETRKGMRERTLAEYKKQLGVDHFVETPSRRALVDRIQQYWAQGQNVLATGPTGSGKTELFFHASQRLFNKDARVNKITVHPDMTTYEIYGKDTVKGFSKGPLTRAIDDDGPAIIDEINATSDNRLLMRLKADLNARPGQEITIQEENGVRHKVGENFAVGATANIKSEKHADRIKLDPALVRMFEALPVDYLPPHELYDIMLASMIDSRGGVKLSLRDAGETLPALCDVARNIQLAYEGQPVILPDGKPLLAQGGEATGKIATLREAVLDPGRAINMLNGWDAARIEGKTFREFLNEKIIAFINNENFPVADRMHLTELFALKNFLQGVSVDQLKVPGLSQTVLDTWSGWKGKRIVSTHQYIDPDIVTSLDPYGVNFAEQINVDDLLGDESQVDDINTKNTVRQESKQKSMKFSPLAQAKYDLFLTLNVEKTAPSLNSYITAALQILKAYPELTDAVLAKIEEGSRGYDGFSAEFNLGSLKPLVEYVKANAPNALVLVSKILSNIEASNSVKSDSSSKSHMNMLKSLMFS